MNPRASLTLGLEGQVLELHPPDWAAGLAEEPGTFAIYPVTGSLDDNPVAAGATELDDVDHAFEAASGFSQIAHRQRCHLDDVAGVVQGRLYVARNALGQAELVRPWAVDELELTVDAEGPLGFDYEEGDTFRGLRQWFVVPPELLLDEHRLGGWRVLWTYVVDGTERRQWTYFDIVRVAVEPSTQGSDLYDLYPDLRHEQHPDLRGQDFRDVRERALARLRFDLKDFALELDQLRSEDADELLLAGMRVVLGERGWRPPGWDVQAFVDDCRRRYFGDLNKVVARVPVDKGTTGGATEKGAKRLSFGR